MTTPLIHAVMDGLTSVPKRLPPWLLYDADGAQLFEQITQLPEYYLTRVERLILERHATAMVTRAGPGATVVELGAGTASKTAILLRAMLARQERVTFHPLDICETSLRTAVAELSERYAQLRVEPLVASYQDSLECIRTVPAPRLVLFLGSSIGNLEPQEARTFLLQLRGCLAEGDSLLVGTDLAKKSATLLPAYADARGVTAQFNKNILARINRELGGHFDLEKFQHVTVWNAKASRMEMHLESLMVQEIPIDGLGITVRFNKGERLHTENSYKFTLPVVQDLLTNAGFLLEESWQDERGWYAVSLARARGC
ncbi:MAG: L-histidine N(alpha)-methyltransferase [Myxococcota bacterium]